MKTTIASCLALILLLGSCGSDPKEDPQYQQYVEDARRAETAVAQRDSALNDMFSAMNRISENLRTIRSRQGELPGLDRHFERGSTIEHRIMADIEHIDELIAENQMLMERLRRHADISAGGLHELQKTIVELEASIRERDAEIGRYKEELSSSNSTMASLIAMYRDKAQLAESQRDQLNTAWYTVGTIRELRANGILSREGGVAGIGGVNKLDVSNMPRNYFRRIDVLTQQEIPVVAKKASLVTPHPQESYHFENGAEKLVITDTDKFWSISKYLVVVVE
jgi:hypothetical protein